MPKPPKVIAQRFESRGLAGSGGQAVIRRAYDRHTDAHVALRITQASSKLSRVPGDVLRCLLNLQSDAAVFEIERIDNGDTHIEIMPWAQGVVLDGVIRRLNQGAGIQDTCTVGLILCQCIEQVHQVGVCHRDIKTNNVVVEEGVGNPVLLDFGGAACMGSQQSVFGTPGASAPEQFDTHTAHPSADVYSLGGLLYALASGSYPFMQPSASSRIDAARAGDFVSLATVLPGAPSDFTTAIDSALAPDPSARPSLKELTATLAKHSKRDSLRIVRCAACGASDDGGSKCPCCGRTYSPKALVAEFKSGSLANRTYRFPDGQYVTGRIQLRDHARFTSRRTVQVQSKAGSLQIKNESDKNPTRLNGKVPTSWRTVQRGHQIQLGNSVAQIT